MTISAVAAKIAGQRSDCWMVDGHIMRYSTYNRVRRRASAVNYQNSSR